MLSCRREDRENSFDKADRTDPRSNSTAGQLLPLLPPLPAVLRTICFTQRLKCLLFYIRYLLLHHHENHIAGHIIPSLRLILRASVNLTFEVIHVRSPWQSTQDRYSTAWQNIIKKIKSALQAYASHITSNNQTQDTPSFALHAVPAKPLLVTRLKHLDPEFVQNEARKTCTVFCNMGFVYLKRKSKPETSEEVCLCYDRC